MDLIIIILLGASLLLFTLSFFAKDKTKDLEKQIETLSMTFMQDIYQLKKKIQILEEELLTSHEGNYYMHKEKNTKSTELLNEVIGYYEAGYSFDKIAQLTKLSENEVFRLIENYRKDE